MRGATISVPLGVLAPSAPPSSTPRDTLRLGASLTSPKRQPAPIVAEISPLELSTLRPDSSPVLACAHLALASKLRNDGDPRPSLAATASLLCRISQASSAFSSVSNVSPALPAPSAL